MRPEQPTRSVRSSEGGALRLTPVSGGLMRRGTLLPDGPEGAQRVQEGWVDATGGTRRDKEVSTQRTEETALLGRPRLQRRCLEEHALTLWTELWSS
ncbi:hypothetical protein NDU88_003377 [Pleurodeles waltl]|uniref:Uncharacterized protein n=1 Tax=Pleurodeles waltl TaxID=8319 RepID=A0AAV7UE40_PLEWA|nr:hypothetical protein NDU88_003377 [Pleurodeles waltl]